MKVIFLDVDGVLNSTQYFKSRQDKEYDIDISTLPLLKKIVEATNAKIVLSSTWRYLKNSIKGQSNKHYKSLIQSLKQYDLEIYDTTPDMRSYGLCRGEEIQLWLDNQDNIESFVILDDEDDMDDLIQYLVQTSFYDYGLQEKHIDKAIRMLNKEEENE